MEKLVIAGREFNSRLFLGTGKFNNNQLMAEAIKAYETEMVTVAMKRIELEDKQDDLLSHIVQNPNIQLLPNTSGVRNAEEAVFAAQMAREAFGTNWLKLEIHPDPRYLLPDSIETLKATEKLVKLGFVVLPYCQADPTLCKHLEEAGAATVMPLAGNLLELLGIVAVENPLLAHSWQALLQINLIVRVAVRTAGIVDVNRSVWLCMWNAALILHNSRSEVYLGHSNLDLWEKFSLHIRLFSLGVSFLIVWHNV